MNYPDATRKDTVQAGFEFQDFVADVMAGYGIAITPYTSRKYQFERGENRQGIEIKLDSGCHKSSRLSVEIAERTSLQSVWVNSGIYRDDNTWLYVQGSSEGFFVFSVRLLRMLHSTGRYQSKEEPTLRAFYLPFKDAEKYAALVWRPAS